MLLLCIICCYYKYIKGAVLALLFMMYFDLLITFIVQTSYSNHFFNHTDHAMRKKHQGLHALNVF